MFKIERLVEEARDHEKNTSEVTKRTIDLCHSGDPNNSYFGRSRQSPTVCNYT